MSIHAHKLCHDEGIEVEGAEEAGGVVVLVRGRFGRRWASLRRTVVASMAHIMKKYVDSR